MLVRNPYEVGRELGLTFLGGYIRCSNRRCPNVGKSYHNCGCEGGREHYYRCFAVEQGKKDDEWELAMDMVCPTAAHLAEDKPYLACHEVAGSPCRRAHANAYAAVLAAMGVKAGDRSARGKGAATVAVATRGKID